MNTRFKNICIVIICTVFTSTSGLLADKFEDFKLIDENKKQPFYETKSQQFVNLVKGVYGKTPFPVDPEFRLKIAGTKKESPYDTTKYEKQPNPEA